MRLSSLAVALALLMPCDAIAQQPNNTNVTVDITKLDSVARDRVLDAVKASAPSPSITSSQVSEWAQTGKGVGEAIAAAAKAVNTGVNDFIKTPAGILTIWVILGYLFGHQLIGLVFGPIIWAVLGFVIWRSAMIFFRPYTKKLKDGSVIDRTFIWRSADAKGFVAFAHMLAFLALSIAMIIIIF